MFFPALKQYVRRRVKLTGFCGQFFPGLTSQERCKRRDERQKYSHLQTTSGSFKFNRYSGTASDGLAALRIRAHSLTFLLAQALARIYSVIWRYSLCGFLHIGIRRDGKSRRRHRFRRYGKCRRRYRFLPVSLQRQGKSRFPGCGWILNFVSHLPRCRLLLTSHKTKVHSCAFNFESKCAFIYLCICRGMQIPYQFLLTEQKFESEKIR